ncbi:MAG: hypothetical protein AB8C46_01075 [Burkholderiaceae bacterium]
MIIFKRTFYVAMLASMTLMAATGCSSDDDVQASRVNQAVNIFQNSQATGGTPQTVDAKGPVDVTDAVEFPGFAFGVYDVNVTANSVTMKLVAQLENLQITLYDDTTFDRYYFEFDREIPFAELSNSTDENFSATVELVSPGTTVITSGAFVDGLPSEFTFAKGGILITVGEGTDLTKITENQGSLTVNF